jgi:hypothetical protein
LFDNAWALWLAFGEWMHGIFVAPLCLGLLPLKRKQLVNVPIHGSSWGLLVLFVAGLAYWLGALADLQYVGFVAVREALHSTRFSLLTRHCPLVFSPPRAIPVAQALQPRSHGNFLAVGP